MLKENPSAKEMKKEILLLFNENSDKTLCFHSSDIEMLWRKFVSIFEVIHAGGGLVANSNNEYLFIYRNEKWDLPKGKLDSGETIEECAVREVEEECGIHNLQLGSKIKNTYHIYQYKEKTVLKFTHWYHMIYPGNEELVPQLEEGITKVEWLGKEDFDKVKENTYGNILEVVGS